MIWTELSLTLLTPLSCASSTTPSTQHSPHALLCSDCRRYALFCHQDNLKVCFKPSIALLLKGRLELALVSLRLVQRRQRHPTPLQVDPNLAHINLDIADIALKHCASAFELFCGEGGASG
jgi:hypothetical protein